MVVDPMFILATLAFAWGLSLATYRWFAVHNGWPMGEWQAHRPGLPIAIGIFAMAFAILFGLARNDATVVIVPLFGILCALAWTAVTRVGAQSTLLLAPIAVLWLLGTWYASAIRVPELPQPTIDRPALDPPRERNGRVVPADRQPIPLPPLPASPPQR